MNKEFFCGQELIPWFGIHIIRFVHLIILCVQEVVTHII